MDIGCLGLDGIAAGGAEVRIGPPTTGASSLWYPSSRRSAADSRTAIQLGNLADLIAITTRA